MKTWCYFVHSYSTEPHRSDYRSVAGVRTCIIVRPEVRGETAGDAVGDGVAPFHFLGQRGQHIAAAFQDGPESELGVMQEAEKQLRRLTEGS